MSDDGFVKDGEFMVKQYTKKRKDIKRMKKKRWGSPEMTIKKHSLNKELRGVEK